MTARTRRSPRGAISGPVLSGVYFFAFFAAGGVSYPYINLFFQSAGMTNQQIGVLAALPPLITVFASPLWASLADRFNLHRVLLPGLLLGTLLPAAFLPGAALFWTLAVLIVAFNFFISPTIPLAENAIITMLGDRQDRYGSIRLWGAVGFGISSLAMGHLSGLLGMQSIWWVYIALAIPTIVVAARLPIPRMPVSAAYLASLRALARSRRWRGFLGAALLVGIGYAMYDNFYAIHVKALGASPGLIGLLFMAATVSEIPVFFFASRLIRRLSLRGVMTLAFTAFALRGLAWAFVTTPEWGVAVQLMHGISFSALWTAAVLYVSRIAPPGLGASGQALFVLTFMGLGRAIGAVLGAQLYDRLGGPLMFGIGAGVALLGVALFMFTEARTDRFEARQAGP